MYVSVQSINAECNICSMIRHYFSTFQRKRSRVKPELYRDMWFGDWLQISSNGVLSLNESSSTQSVPHGYLAVHWPNPHYSPLSPGAVDPPLVAPFYADTDFRVGQPYDPGQLSWRVIDRDSVGSSVSAGMLDQISEDVRRASVDAANFVARWGVVVTWYEVTFSGANCTTEMNVDTCLVGACLLLLLAVVRVNIFLIELATLL